MWRRPKDDSCHWRSSISHRSIRFVLIHVQRIQGKLFYTQLIDTDNNNCTLPTVGQNVTIRRIIDEESGLHQIILSCNTQTSDNGTSPVFIANCTNNGMWTPDPNGFTCLDSGSESDGNSVRPSDNTGIVLLSGLYLQCISACTYHNYSRKIWRGNKLAVRAYYRQIKVGQYYHSSWF